MTIESIINIILFALAILSFFLGQKLGAKKEGERQGALLTELEYIKRDLQEIKQDFKQINAEKIHAELNELRAKHTGMSKSIERIHDRIDDHLNRQHNISVERAIIHD